jgi:hypothetical protein
MGKTREKVKFYDGLSSRDSPFLPTMLRGPPVRRPHEALRRKCLVEFVEGALTIWLARWGVMP